MLILVAGLLAVTGCAAPPAAAPGGAADPIAGVPVDLVIDVTILAGRKVPLIGRVESRRGRFVLFPDGALLASSGDPLDTDDLPPWARTLSSEQIADVWAVAGQVGLADPSASDSVGNPALVQPGPDELVTIITMQAEGRRWSSIRRRSSVDAADPASARFIRHLASYAWITDSLEDRHIMPRRYDMGDDPYARYRR